MSEDFEHKSSVNEVSSALLHRLPKYHNYLRRLRNRGTKYISSAKIAEDMMLNPVLVRKDLAQISTTPGKPRLGFEIDALVKDFDDFLGYNKEDRAILVGAGNLGKALMSYAGFRKYGLEIVAAFDNNESVQRYSINGKQILPLDRMREVVGEHDVRLGIITVPSSEAQMVCDQMVASGIRGILNFAPVHLDTPESVVVQEDNIAVSLALLAKKIQREKNQ